MKEYDLMCGVWTTCGNEIENLSFDSSKSIDVSIFLSCIHNQSDNTPTKFGT